MNSTPKSRAATDASANILIVDDELEVVRLLELLLRTEGYATQSAANGEEALAAIARCAPDLILLDIMMPGMDGYAVARRLKADAATANIPIILITAQSEREARLAGLQAGAEDFLSKPVDRSELWLRVRNLLRLKKFGDALQKHNQQLEQEVQQRVADLHLFRSAMDASVDGIFLVDRDSMRFVEINATGCVMLGYTRNELFERSPADLLSATVPQLQSAYDALIAGKDTADLTQVQLFRKDGSEFQAEVRRHPYASSAGWIIVSVVRDVTERKRAEQEVLRYLAQLKSSLMSTVKVATALSELRDPYTAGHERRVGEIAAAIGVEMGLDLSRQEGLRVAGYLHDVGKISVPSELLSKPGRLSAVEFQLVQQHPQVGFDVLKDVDFPWPVAQVALQHHERLDGSGYPQGLKGDAILFEARIMSVADVVEAISSHRPYRAALGLDTALAEIERGRATLYDPDVVTACLRLFREHSFQLPN